MISTLDRLFLGIVQIETVATPSGQGKASRYFITFSLYRSDQPTAMTTNDVVNQQEICSYRDLNYFWGRDPVV